MGWNKLINRFLPWWDVSAREQSLLAAIASNQNYVLERIDSMAFSLNERIDSMAFSLNERIDFMAFSMNQRIDSMKDRIDSIALMNQSTNERIDSIQASIQSTMKKPLASIGPSQATEALITTKILEEQIAPNQSEVEYAMASIRSNEPSIHDWITSHQSELDFVLFFVPSH